MQNILSIDISGDTAVALICAVEGASIRVVERAQVELEDAISLLVKKQEEPSEGEEQTVTEENPEDKLSACLSTLLDKLTLPFTNVVIVAPTLSYLSLNLALPFNTPKNINKVLDYEIQDGTPLEPSEFIIYPKAVAKVDDGGFDVHVSMLPKDFLTLLLKACRKAGIEPYIITTVTSAIAAAYLLAPTPLSENSVFIHVQNGVLALTAVINGAIRFDRILSNTATTEEDSTSEWFKSPKIKNKLNTEAIHDLKLTIKSLEQKYQIEFDKAYLFGDYLPNLDPLELSIINMTALIQGAGDDDVIAAMASIFAEDYDAPTPLTNFRTGELSYHYQYKELFKGLRRLIPLSAVVALLIVSFTYIVYQARERKITKIQNELRAEISRIVPSSSKHSIEEISEISDNLEKELNSLGMSSVVSPIEAFILISEDINNVKQTNKDLDITKLDITQNSAFILATAPTYNDFDTMKSVLKKRKNYYCSVKFNQKNSHPKRQAEFAIDFCKK